MSKVNSNRPHPEKTLVMLTNPTSARNNMPHNIIGLTANSEADHVTIFAPLTADLGYYAKEGEKVRLLISNEQVRAAKEKNVLCTLPQLSVLDWAFAGLSDPNTYHTEACIEVPREGSYLIPVADESPFGQGYYATLDELADAESPLSKHLAGTMFSLDVRHMTSMSLHPEKATTVLLPPEKPAEYPGAGGPPHVIGANR